MIGLHHQVVDSLKQWAAGFTTVTEVDLIRPCCPNRCGLVELTEAVI